MNQTSSNGSRLRQKAGLPHTLPTRLLAKAATVLLAAAVVVAPGLLAWTPAAQQPPKTQPTGEVQDFVFLAEARPILIRIRAQLDGVSVQAGYDAFLKHLFTNLDMDGDGVLSKAEAERMPPLDQIISGTLVSGFAAFGGGGGPAGPSFAELDTNKDGKVSLAELTAYCRGKGFTPFQAQIDSRQQNPFGMMMGSQSQPTVAAIGEAVFALLDTDQDGKLSQKELAAAPEVLLRKDENEDDMLVPRELLPPAKEQKGNAGAMMAFPGNYKAPDNPYVVLVDATGNAPDLVRRVQERYAKGAVAAEMKLSRQVLGLDEKTFAALDTNGDGFVDAKELAAFVKRTPDVELVLRLGTRELTEKGVQVLSSPGIRGVNLKTRDHLALFELGATRLELRGHEGERPDRLGGILRAQFLAAFKQSDKAGKGYLEAKQAEGNPLLRNVFKAMDRDGDGKVTEQEFLAYLDHLGDLKKRARAACVTMIVEDQSRGLFDLLDADRDGRLSVREMRGADRLLLELGCVGKGFLTKSDLPRSYLLKLRRGPATQGGFDLSEAFEQAYQGSYEEEAAAYTYAGPMWFRKMDRNRDGDVSRKEFLGTDELFREIDADGDGLISAAEAERYDALSRKKQ